MWAFGSLLASRHCRIRLMLQIPYSSYLHNLCKYVFGFLQSFVPLLVSPPARHRMMLMIAQPAKILAWLNEVKIFFAELHQEDHLLFGHLTSAGWRWSGICSRSSASRKSTCYFLCFFLFFLINALAFFSDFMNTSLTLSENASSSNEKKKCLRKNMHVINPRKLFIWSSSPFLSLPSGNKRT